MPKQIVNKTSLEVSHLQSGEQNTFLDIGISKSV